MPLSSSLMIRSSYTSEVTHAQKVRITPPSFASDVRTHARLYKGAACRALFLHQTNPSAIKEMAEGEWGEVTFKKRPMRAAEAKSQKVCTVRGSISN